jgi:hypothetical protein
MSIQSEEKYCTRHYIYVYLDSCSYICMSHQLLRLSLYPEKSATKFVLFTSPLNATLLFYYDEETGFGQLTLRRDPAWVAVLPA